MSQENIDLLRRAYEGWNRGDPAAIYVTMDPDVELVLPEGGVNTGTRRGPEAVKQFAETYIESFDGYQLVPEGFFAEGDDVLVFIRQCGRGRASGVEVENEGAHLLTLRNGKVVRLEVFTDRARAVEVVGLEAAGQDP